MKIDKKDLITVGLTIVAGAASVAKFLWEKNTDDKKLEEAVQKVLDKRSK